MAIKLAIEPIFEHTFRDSSYGFRPERGCKDALREVDTWLKLSYTWVVDADIKGYFDTISHELMMRKVEQHIADKRLLRLLESYLKQDIMSECASWKPSQGTPQGAVLSPLLANIYLNELDHLIGEKYRMVRYADDFVILTNCEADAEKALAEVREWMASHQLELHRNRPAATHGLPDLLLASSQFLVRIDNENKYTMAAACGSLAREWLEPGGLLSPARPQSQNLFTVDTA